jgi:hypothetical protein
MANRATFGGLRWRGSFISPSANVAPIEILPIADDYGTALYIGDPVKLVSTGYIEAASAGNTLYGVFAGCEQYYDGTSIRKGGKYPASQSYDTNFERQTLARIIPCFGQIFEMCTDDVGGTYDTYAEHLAFIGENCEWIAGTASGDNSGALLDISTHNTTNTLSLNLRGLSKQPDTDYAALGVRYYVTVNLLQQPTAGSTTGT